MPTKDLKPELKSKSKANARLEEAAAKLAAAADLLVQGIVLTDPKFNTVYISSRALELAGEDFGNGNFMSTLARLSGKKSTELVAKLESESSDGSYIHLGERVMGITIRPEQDGQQTIGWVITLRDVSSRAWVFDRLTALISNLNDGFVVIDETDTVLNHNREWLELFGVSEPILGRKMADVLEELQPLEFDNDPKEIFNQCLVGKKVLIYCFDPKRNRHLQFSAGPLLIAGRSLGLIATGRDITDLVEKTIEANALAMEAQKTNRKLRDLADIASIYSLNVEKLYQKFTSHLVSLTESPYVSIYVYSPEKLKMERVATSTSFNEHPEEVPVDKNRIVGSAFLSRKLQVQNREEKGGDGVFAHHTMCAPISSHSKSLGCILVSRTDKPYTQSDASLFRIAATRKAFLLENARLYQETNARRERWEAVFRFTDDGVVIYDHDGNVVGFNATCAEMTGYSVSEAIGQPFTKIIRAVSPEGVDLALRSPMKEVLSQGRTVSKSEQLIETKRGDRFWANVSYSPMRDQEGNVTSGIAVIRSIQRDREIEEIKSDFISIVSHELRTPLSAIKGFMSMLLNKDFGELTDRQFHFLSRVYQSNQRMINLVEDLLDISHIEGGKINLDLRPLPMENIIRDVVTELAGKAFERDITLKINRRYRLPLVLADESRLRQVLTNLVDNAIKYSLPKSEVTIDFKIHGDELITSVTDKGVGITPSQIGKLFQKFGRVFNPMTVQAGGTGLGLYIVKNLVEAHGGRIWVTSREAAGSKFSFSLPVAKQLTLLS